METTMRRLHLVVGILTVVAFLITGQVMSHHQPAMAMLSDGERMMFRSRHIYILASGLINLMLGLYLRRWQSSWRAITQTAGSLLLIVAPVLLILAFGSEPKMGPQSVLRWSANGLFALFGGCMAHLASSIGARHRRQEQNIAD
jgi:hypothetical protein